MADRAQFARRNSLKKGSLSAQRAVTGKPVVLRTAVVTGELSLSRAGRKLLKTGNDKGMPLQVAATAGLMAMKRTPEMIPHCHIVPLTGSSVRLHPTGKGVRVEARAEAVWQTGVEMEALLGATVALLTVWDMVKYVEKDETGGYPETEIGPVRVVSKTKSVLARA